MDQKETKKAEESDNFSEVEHKLQNPVASLDYVRVNKLNLHVVMNI